MRFNIHKPLTALVTALLALTVMAAPANAEPTPQPSAPAASGEHVPNSGPWTVRWRIVDPYPCWEIAGGSTANNARADVAHCAGRNAKWEWYMNNVTGSYWQLMNSKSGKCLYPENDSTADGAAISQETCNAANVWQRWRLVLRDTGSGSLDDHYSFVNAETGKCINHRNALAQGILMLQKTCTYNEDKAAAEPDLTDWFTWWNAA